MFHIPLFFIQVITLGQIPKSQITGTKYIKIVMTKYILLNYNPKDRPTYSTQIIVDA